jgi:transposase
MEKILLENLVNQNLTIAQISDIVGKSKTSVRHWLKKYNITSYNLKNN